jgi:hypothetical protein
MSGFAKVNLLEVEDFRRRGGRNRGPLWPQAPEVS